MKAKNLSRVFLTGVTAVSLALLITLPALAQTTQLQVKLRRNFGSALGNQIQGSFTISASGPQNLASVTYYIDNTEMGTVNAAPFGLAFNTDQFSPGQHTFTARGRTTDGQQLESDSQAVDIMTGAQAWKTAQGILIPIFGLVLGVLVLSVVATARAASRNAQLPPSERHYGIAGGAICPKCGRPFPLAAFAPNMLTGKLVRCPYCSKWSVVRAASRDALAAAEAAEQAGAQPQVQELSAEEKLRRQIEESRYQ